MELCCLHRTWHGPWGYEILVFFKFKNMEKVLGNLRVLCCFPECDITYEYYYNLFLFDHESSYKNALHILGNGKPLMVTQINKLPFV